MLRALILLCFLGGSDDTKSHRATCPVDGHKFKAIEILKVWHWGGKDKDFCAHTHQTLPMESYVWVCPKCRYAGMKKDFDKGTTISEDLKKRFLEELKPAIEIKRHMKQHDIPGWVKYDLLAQVQKIRGADEMTLGRTYLSASWAARQRGAVKLMEFDEWTEIRKKYGITKTPIDVGLGKNRADYEMKQAARLTADLEKGKWKSGPKSLLARYLAAWLHRRRGENEIARMWITEIESRLKDQPFSLVEDALKEMKASIPIERKFQRLAAEHFAKIVESKTGNAKVELYYMLGELHRRMEEKGKAKEWFDKGLEIVDKGLEATSSEEKLKPDKKSKRRRWLEGMKELCGGQRKLVDE